MRRAAPALAALLLPLLAVPAPAQPWASETARSAGRAALAAAAQGREDPAALAASDPLVAKIATWQRLQRRGGAGARELVAWLAANPDWPLPNTLAARAEEALLREPEDALVLAHFDRHPPRGLEGVARRADALLRAGRAGEAAAEARRGWAAAPGDAPAEAAFLPRHAALLDEASARARFERLYLSRDAAGAARAAALLPAPKQPAVTFRLALLRGEAEPMAATDDPGALAVGARLLRRADRDREAAGLLARADALRPSWPAEAEGALWSERQILVRRLLRLGEDRLAYAAAARPGYEDGGEASREAEFLAGWIALRRLGDPAAAAPHLARVGQGSSSVITRARAAYWEGRAAEARGQPGGARTLWDAGARLPTAFYGHLSALALGEDEAALEARIRGTAPPAPGAEAAGLLLDRELAAAAIALTALDEPDRARIFLLRLEEMAADPPERVLAARLGAALGRPDHAVWVARRAGARGVMMLPEGWPTPYPAPPGVEPALVHAVARQESNFDPRAVSRADARGVMQLLPATAAAVARQLGLPHRPGWLTSDPAHNMRLGAQYLADQLDRFGGNPVLAAAAYNAGPRRAAEWLETYGAPGPGGPDILDWIEQIPFQETRNYVQRVVENQVIYRALEGGAARPHPLRPWMAPR